MIYFIKLTENETEKLCNMAQIDLENEEDYTDANVVKAIKKIIASENLQKRGSR